MKIGEKAILKCRADYAYGDSPPVSHRCTSGGSKKEEGNVSLSLYWKRHARLCP